MAYYVVLVEPPLSRGGAGRLDPPMLISMRTTAYLYDGLLLAGLSFGAGWGQGGGGPGSPPGVRVWVVNPG